MMLGQLPRLLVPFRTRYDAKRPFRRRSRAYRATDDRHRSLPLFLARHVRAGNHGNEGLDLFASIEIRRASSFTIITG